MSIALQLQKVILKAIPILIAWCCHDSYGAIPRTNMTLPDSAMTKAYLVVTSIPDSVIIRLNGTELGHTPIQRQIIPGGHLKLWGVNPDKTNWLALDWIQLIDVKPGETLHIHIDFTKLTTRPEKPVEFSGNSTLMNSPIKPVLNTGDSNFQTSMNGQKDPEIPFNYSSLYSYNQEQKQNQMKSLKKRWMLATMSLSILSGLASVHFRDKANGYYGDYQKTSNPTAMDNYFDNTKYFDCISGISYGVFQFSFLTTVYLFLSSR